MCYQAPALSYYSEERTRAAYLLKYLSRERPSQSGALLYVVHGTRLLGALGLHVNFNVRSQPYMNVAGDRTVFISKSNRLKQN
jgi:hypothetical protein